ncbi:MAG: lipoprotein-releasing system permease protein [Rhodobacteraceae bacterium HLUCCA08]|nr:MAG: lipoprotein-releasing system permease protein [Rhodobacteraceae bacterium HLUCCA08]
MAGRTAPFSRFEWMIAWRYIRAKRAEGGVSAMTWISLIGITLAVFALVATLAVRSGLRADMVDIMVGSSPHVTVRMSDIETITVTQGDFTQEVQRRIDTIAAYDDWRARIAGVDGVERVDPVVSDFALMTLGQTSHLVNVNGIRPDDLAAIPRVVEPIWREGSLADFGRAPNGIAIGRGVADQLGLGVGSRVTLLTANGVQTAAGRSPRSASFEVIYVFQTGGQILDRSRVYMPLDKAQDFFGVDGAVDQLQVFLHDPEDDAAMKARVSEVLPPGGWLYSWKDESGDFLRALALEDNALFILLSILVLIASMNIVSGLIMLVKNKGRDIGILRTMGLDQSSVLRVFFLCGAWIGTFGTLLGVILGAVFALNIDHVYSFVNWLSGSGVDELTARGFIFPSAILRAGDIAMAAGLSLGLSWGITLFPARRAARMNPVEALRYE